tara:strand:- start:8842 stop:10404 length:1563 start_codon:yes stop_codon:yes gene_type:complete
MDGISLTIGLIGGLAIGGTVAYVLVNKVLNSKKNSILAEAEKEAEIVRKEKAFQAKEKFQSLKEKHEEEVSKRKASLHDLEKRVKEYEQKNKLNFEEYKAKDKALRQEQKDHTFAVKKLEENTERLQKKERELDAKMQEAISTLEKVAGTSKEEAKGQLVEMLKDEAKTEAALSVQHILDEAKLTANTEAKKVVITAIQRVATEHSIENSVSNFQVGSDENKGKIIGREGRNIRSFEAATGVELIVDDTPETITISCFDSVRREIARLALHQLVSDGRIHPERIERVVEKVTKDLEEEIFETGKRTCVDLGIHGLAPELIRYVGRMRYRSSYGQNLLQHSREVANLCAIMAAELGLNAKKAKRAGLLHDIGKVLDTESETPHAILGMQWAEKYGEPADICNAIGAHHDEIEMTSLLSPIIQVCDAISGARPGARREVMESYIKRIKDLEKIASDINGVAKAYAIQAGRELRVMVDCDRVDDAKAAQISFDISQKIQNEMTYPGQVKVTVIREMRAVSTAH